MARSREDIGGRRLLEAWEPPAGAGDAIGCVATTFTFDPVFFEEHCLSRFLRLETDPREREDGAAYLIEREEKLAVTRVSVLVDRSTVEGSASARWDVLPVRVPGGILHAKISVLAWHGCIRVLIGSANLTQQAYRKNQEVFGVLDFRDQGLVPIEVLGEILRFLERIADLAPGRAVEMGPKARLLHLLGDLSQVSQGWIATPPKLHESPRVMPMLLGPMAESSGSIPGRLGQLVRAQGGPAHSALVLSPFFDQTGEAEYPATTALLGALTDRGRRYVVFLIPAEALPDGRVRLRAPKAVLRSERKTADFAIYPITEEVDGEICPLHAKSLWLWNDSWHLYMVGSSNFTKAGLGVGGRPSNVEANLAYIFPEDSAMRRRMEHTLPSVGDEIRDADAALWEPVEEAEDEGAGSAVLPLGFEEALFEPKEEGGTLQLRFGTALPAEWAILPSWRSGEMPVVYSAQQWLTAQRPSVVEIPWNEKKVPKALPVEWRGESDQVHSAVWPVNVTDPNRLPPPDDLRNLPLETLLEILGSRRPLHEAVKEAKRKVTEGSKRMGAELAVELDPHRRVRTETFLLQRTLRVAKAIERLVEALNRPIMHRDVLIWRLRGPVGPLALAHALKEAARSPGEACFLLSEVALALRRLDVAKIGIGVTQEEVRRELDAVRTEIEELALGKLRSDETVPPDLKRYVLEALEEARR